MTTVFLVSTHEPYNSRYVHRVIAIPLTENTLNEESVRNYVLTTQRYLVNINWRRNRKPFTAIDKEVIKNPFI